MNKANKNMPLRYNTSAAGILSLVIKILLTEGQVVIHITRSAYARHRKVMVHGLKKF